MNNNVYFKPVILKLSRARIQIEEISLILQNSWDVNRIVITPQICDDKMGYELYTNDFSDDNFLEEIGLRIGELIHNLRSVLDNLIFGLARLKQDPPPFPYELTFPIYTNKEIFDKNAKKIFNQIPENVKALIVSVQPFSQKQSNPEFKSEKYVLSIIQWLNNADKHRVPKVLLAIPDKIKFDGSIEFDNEEFNSIIDKENGFSKFFPIVPNSKIFEFRTTEKIKKINMNFGVDIKVVIEVFNDNYEIHILENLYNEIVFLSNSLIDIVNSDLTNPNNADL